jgi:hypothetical protein
MNNFVTFFYAHIANRPASLYFETWMRAQRNENYLFCELAVHCPVLFFQVVLRFAGNPLIFPELLLLISELDSNPGVNLTLAAIRMFRIIGRAYPLPQLVPYRIAPTVADKVADQLKVFRGPPILLEDVTPPVGRSESLNDLSHSLFESSIRRSSSSSTLSLLNETF